VFDPTSPESETAFQLTADFVSAHVRNTEDIGQP